MSNKEFKALAMALRMLIDENKIEGVKQILDVIIMDEKPRENFSEDADK